MNDEQNLPSPIVAWAIVAALFAAYILSFIDRMIIGLLVEPMKADLGVSDTQISLLQGMAFALFYTFAGLPLGRLIDSAPRMKIVAIGVAVWSVTTAACGVAGSYWQLFVARMGVGVGEATLSPAAYSIIADSFPKRRLGLAMGVYGLGSAIGAGLAFMIGAAVIKFVAAAGEVSLPIIGVISAWQMAFFVVGLPGLAMAALFALMPEPPRRYTAADGASAPTWKAIFGYVGRNAGSLLVLFFAVGAVNLAVIGAVSWLPVLYMRVHGLELASAGYLAGGALIVGGLIGMIGGGLLMDRLSDGGPAGRLAFCGVTGFIGLAGGVVFPLVDDPWLAAVAFVAFFSAAAVTIGAAPTVIQQLTPNRMRATVSAGYLFIVNIIGLGLGPTVTAVISDTWFPTQDGIRFAIAIVAPCGFAVAIVLFFVAARYVRRAELRAAPA